MKKKKAKKLPKAENKKKENKEQPDQQEAEVLQEETSQAAETQEEDTSQAAETQEEDTSRAADIPEEDTSRAAETHEETHPDDSDLLQAPLLTEKDLPPDPRLKHKAARPSGHNRKGIRYHGIRRFRHLSRHEQRRQVRIGFVMLIIMLFLTIGFIYKDYHERPGILERSSLKATEVGTDSMTIEWKGTRNTDSYTVYYKAEDDPAIEWNKVTIENKKGSKDSITLEDLEEGTRYGVIVRADNEERTGFSTKEKIFSTRRHQKIKGKDHFTKLTCSEDFNLGFKAETPLSYKSDDESVVKVNKKGKVTIKGRGTAKITVTAAATKEFIGDETETEIEVISTTPVNAGGASAHIIYNIGPGNCEKVRYISGSGGAVTPQAFGYTGEEYIVAYGMSGSQRIISFDKDGDGKSVSVPAIALGHPNGFCYADSNKTCYCVKGWSGRAVTYKPETGEYGTVTFPYGASGIGYDREKDYIYTCSRTAMIAYSIGDDGYSIEHRCGVVRHSGKTFTQDCGGHAGIMMRCLSGSAKHGTNYVDLYDMIHGQYLGSIACDLSEVESATVDEDGYMLILSNTSDSTDIIWKTPINIGDIGAGLGD